MKLNKLVKSKIKGIKVSNMVTSSGRAAPNQFEITIPGVGTGFQSYSTLIAIKLIPSGKVILDNNRWDYSNTTGKYRNQFLGEGIAETKKKIESGEYTLDELN